MADAKADAPIVFEGTVKSLKSSNVQSVPADRSTAVIAVDHVRLAPRALAGLAGKEITLRLAKGEKLKPGERGVFSADGLLFAENLALQSRGHDPVAEVARSAAVIGAVPVIERLRRRVNDADTVVAGRVAEVRPTQPPAARARAAAVPERISEHEPVWQQAVIDVSHVHKGAKRKRVVVNFPASRDVMWRKAPKFSKGQTGVFLLHAPEAAMAAAAPRVRAISPPPPNAYLALDPNDYQPPSAAPAVEALFPATATPVLARRTPARATAARGRQKPTVKKSAARKAGAKTAVSKRRKKRG